MFVRSGAIVAGTYKISSSGSRMSVPRRHRITTPATNKPRKASDAAVAAAYTAAAPLNCWFVHLSLEPTTTKTRYIRYRDASRNPSGSRRMLSNASAE